MSHFEPYMVINGEFFSRLTEVTSFLRTQEALVRTNCTGSAAAEVEPTSRIQWMRQENWKRSQSWWFQFFWFGSLLAV
jgi:hypothetical protein